MATFSFDNNPESQTVSTGNYTVPANKYAQVTAYQTDVALIVGGTTIMPALDGFIADEDSGSGTTGNAVSYQNNNTFPVVATAAFNVTSGQYTNITIQLDKGSEEILVYSFEGDGGNTGVALDTTAGGGGASGIVMAPGDRIIFATIGGSSTPIYEYGVNAYSPYATPAVMQFYAPTGQTVNGANKVISVYPE